MSVIIIGTVRAVTEKAVLVSLAEVDGIMWPLDEEDEVWFPKSKCDGLDDAEKGDGVEFDCPTWIADEKNLL